MNDESFIRLISTMSPMQLLALCMDEPGYLTDPYYREFAVAMRKRYAEMSATPRCPKCNGWIDNTLTADGTWNCANCKNRWLGAPK